MPYTRRTQPFEKTARLLRGYCGNGAALGRTLGYSEPTGRKKLSDPGEMTLRDVQHACQRLHIPKEDFLASIDW